MLSVVHNGVHFTVNLANDQHVVWLHQSSIALNQSTPLDQHPTLLGGGDETLVEQCTGAY
jgi:hypothetical protein